MCSLKLAKFAALACLAERQSVCSRLLQLHRRLALSKQLYSFVIDRSGPGPDLHPDHHLIGSRERLLSCTACLCGFCSSPRPLVFWIEAQGHGHFEFDASCGCIGNICGEFLRNPDQQEQASKPYVNGGHKNISGSLVAADHACMMLTLSPGRKQTRMLLKRHVWQFFEPHDQD